MSSSSTRKQALVGWANNYADFTSNVQHQKFLFFYECLSKIAGDEYEMDGLKGYRNGPVFSTVFSDNKYCADFLAACGQNYPVLSGLVNIRRANLSMFLVKSLGNKLSEFTHGLNIWAAKKSEIEKGGYQVALEESDFSEQDASIFRDIENAYTEGYVSSVDVLNINGKAFVYYKSDKNKLSDTVKDAIYEAAFDPEYDGPVYISFSDGGELLLD